MIIEDKPRQKLALQWDCKPDWLRVLVNQDQIHSYNLPTDEKGKAVQAEAVPITLAFDLLREAIQPHVEEDDIENLVDTETDHMNRLHRAAKDLH